MVLFVPSPKRERGRVKDAVHLDKIPASFNVQSSNVQSSTFTAGSTRWRFVLVLRPLEKGQRH